MKILPLILKTFVGNNEINYLIEKKRKNCRENVVIIRFS